jgi:GTP cyclohydrolase FolE2
LEKATAARERLALLLTAAGVFEIGYSIYCICSQNSDVCLSTVGRVKKIANKNTHSSNRQKGRLRKMYTCNTHNQQAISLITFQETEAVEVPLEKGTAARERLALLLTAAGVFVIGYSILYCF